MAGILRRLARTGGTRLVLRTAKAVPFVGTAVAVGLAGYEIRKKGLINGLISTALDATPFVGAAKNAIELFTGDWLPDKPVGKTATVSATAPQPERADNIVERQSEIP